MQTLLNKFHEHPKILWRIDAIGALISSIFLGLVLRPFAEYIGKPENVILFLAILPLLFFVYDITKLQAPKVEQRTSLKWIALMNGGYCILSFISCIIYRDSLSIMGWLYFIGEILLVFTLARIEWLVALKKST